MTRSRSRCDDGTPTQRAGSAGPRARLRTGQTSRATLCGVNRSLAPPTPLATFKGSRSVRVDARTRAVAAEAVRLEQGCASLSALCFSPPSRPTLCARRRTRVDDQRRSFAPTRATTRPRVAPTRVETDGRRQPRRIRGLAGRRASAVAISPLDAAHPRSRPRRRGASAVATGPVAGRTAPSTPRGTSAAASAARKALEQAPIPTLSQGLDLVVLREPARGRAAQAMPSPSPRHDRRSGSPPRVSLDVATVGATIPGSVLAPERGSSRPSSAATPRNECERRRADLDAKRRQLVETRLRPHTARAQPSRPIATS